MQEPLNPNGTQGERPGGDTSNASVRRGAPAPERGTSPAHTLYPGRIAFRLLGVQERSPARMKANGPTHPAPATLEKGFRV